MFLNVHNSYIYVAMAVMKIIIQEKTRLDAVKFYAYPAACRYMYVTCNM